MGLGPPVAAVGRNPERQGGERANGSGVLIWQKRDLLRSLCLPATQHIHVGRGKSFNHFNQTAILLAQHRFDMAEAQAELLTGTAQG